MKLTEATINELGQILKEEFNLTLEAKELTRLAYCLVGYVGLLLQVENRNEFGNSSGCLIAKGQNPVLDK